MKAQIVRAVVAVALVFVFAIASRTTADSICGPNDYCGGGTAYQYASSHINLTRVLFFQNELASCVNFVADGTTPISSVTFRFWPRPSTGPDWYPMTVKGPIYPGFPQNASYIYGDYPPYSHGPDCELGGGQAAFVQHVAFADGSTWDVPADAPQGAVAMFEPFSVATRFPKPTPFPIPSNTASANSASRAPAGTVFQYATSQVRITQLTSQSALSASAAVGVGYSNTCVAFENDSGQALSSVSFAFLPKQFSDQPDLVISGPIPTGANPVVDSHCALTSGKSVAVSKVVYADGGIWTGPSNAPQGALISQ